MVTLSIIMLAANLLAFGLMWRAGEAPERWGVALVLCSFVLVMLAQDVRIGSWKVGVGGVNLLLFLALWFLAERWARWWLIALSGFQLIILLTHLLPLINQANLLNTGVIARKLVWVGVSIVFFFAAWEGGAAKRFRLEEGLIEDGKV